MATLGGDILTWADIQKRLDPKGMPAQIAELLSQSTPVVNDALWMPSNLQTTHRSTVRIGNPTVNLRRINQGTAASKSTTSQIEDGMSILEAWSHTDAKLLELAGNPAAIRMGEARAFVEAMGQKFEEIFWYGQEIDDDREYNGLTIRYGTPGDNVLDAGGAGADNCSIWLIGWGAEKVSCIYPQHCLAGLRHTDHGLKPWQESTSLGGSVLSAYIDQWMWDCGLVVKDHRYIVRIGSIDVSELQAQTDSQLLTASTHILFLMAKALHRIPNLQACRPVFYLPRTVMEEFDIHALARTVGNVFQTKDVEGRPIVTFRGVPMKIADQLIYTEALV